MELSVMAVIANALAQINNPNVDGSTELIANIRKRLLPSFEFHLQLIALCCPIRSAEQKDVFAKISDFCSTNCRELCEILKEMLNPSATLEKANTGKPMETSDNDVDVQWI